MPPWRFCQLAGINAEGSGRDRPPTAIFPQALCLDPSDVSHFVSSADDRNRLMAVRKIRKPSLRDWQ